MMSHNEIKLFKCDFPDCEYVTNLNSKLKSHYMIHSEEKPYKCDFPGCDFATKRKYYLKDHYKKHTGETPYKCNYPDCDYRCALKQYLDYHILNEHSDDNKFICPYDNCLLIFKFKKDFESHQLIHTDSEFYSCDNLNCEFRSLYKSSLHTHKNRCLYKIK